MNISEIFGPVLQGEGSTIGVPAFFIRMSTCNLMCGGHNASLVKEGKATWWCDSEAVWKKGTPWTPEQIVKKFEAEGELDRILSGRTHIILTGGEPTLPVNMNAIIELYEYIKEKYPFSTPFYELETNGTRYTNGFYDKYIDQVNCSVKLSNSGMPASTRIIPKALAEINDHENVWFKMVVSDEEDWDEIERDFLPHITRDKVMLMPAGGDIPELERTGKVVWNLACKHNLRATTRLQVFTWRMTVGI